MARVGVIMAVRDGAPHLGEAVASVLAQSAGDLELHVVDDGSTDGTPEVLDRFRDPRLRVHRTPPRGRAHARNLALTELGSPLAAILDADDAMEPDRLARQAAFLEARPEVAIVGSAVTLVDGGGRALGRLPPPRRIASLLPRRNVLVHSSVLARTSCLIEAGGYRPAFPIAQDYDLWLRLLEKGSRFAALPEALTRYRQHPGSVTAAARASQEAYAALARACRRARRAKQPEPLPAGEELLARVAADDVEYHQVLGRHELHRRRTSLAWRHGRAAWRLAPASLRTWALLGRLLVWLRPPGKRGTG